MHFFNISISSWHTHLTSCFFSSCKTPSDETFNSNASFLESVWRCVADPDCVIIFPPTIYTIGENWILSKWMKIFPNKLLLIKHLEIKNTWVSIEERNNSLSITVLVLSVSSVCKCISVSDTLSGSFYKLTIIST